MTLLLYSVQCAFLRSPDGCGVRRGRVLPRPVSLSVGRGGQDACPDGGISAEGGRGGLLIEMTRASLACYPLIPTKIANDFLPTTIKGSTPD